MTFFYNNVFLEDTVTLAGPYEKEGPLYKYFDRIIKLVGGGALLPITSFGHSLIHGALAKAESFGIMGIFMGMFDLTAPGISAAIICAFLTAMIFRPLD